MSRPDPSSASITCPVVSIAAARDSLCVGLRDGQTIADAAFLPAEHPVLVNGRAAKLWVAGNEIGVLGEVHPSVRESFELPAQRVCLLELDLDALLSQVPLAWHHQPVPRFPAVTQDLALIVDERIPAVQVRDAIANAGGKLLSKVELFDVYRGDPIAAGKKSLAYRLTYQAMDRTLTDDAVGQMQSRIQRQLEKELGAQLRS